MLNKLPKEFRKFEDHTASLRHILLSTQSYLKEVIKAGIFIEDDLLAKVLPCHITKKINSVLDSHPALIVLGQSQRARATLVNAISGEGILPLNEDNDKWLCILHDTEAPTASSYIFVTTQEREDGDTSSREQIDCEELRRRVKHGGCVPFIVPPDSNSTTCSHVPYTVLPIFLYAIEEESLNDKNIYDLREVKNQFPELPIFFIYTSASTQELTESGQHNLQHLHNADIDNRLLGVVEQLARMGFLDLETEEHNLTTLRPCCGQFCVRSDFVDGLHKIHHLEYFIRNCLQTQLVQAANQLSDIHSQCLRKFILSAFDMAREIQITPRRIQYAREKEGELHRSLMSVASEKQKEITALIEIKLEEMREDLIQLASDYKYQGNNDEIKTQQDIRLASTEIQHLVLTKLSTAVAQDLVQSLACLQRTFIGTLQRCLESLERNLYEQGINLSASGAVKQILTAAYDIKLSTSSSSSLIHSFLTRLRKLLLTLQLPWTAQVLDADWKKEVAMDTLQSLNAARLAKTICTQFRDRINSSHESFDKAIQSLEKYYSGQLERTEEQRIGIRKEHTPRLARLALESTSMCDMIRYGMPKLGKEIGRGQYGVVFSCESWKGTGPCAVKSVVPPDDKHWNDLAMEFYYTRTIPEHQHIVKLRGSVVDTSYGGGYTPAVLLIMDRLSRDLYCGLRTGLKWLTRLQIAIDVVEGIRYLHSQGLVHRDIKLKNVLLDSENRAKLTDLGFCIPEAMMSGSIVGTPVHMAPELLSGHYDSSVDVYAFGILFWYLCAGHVRLPYNFEQYMSKEQLWFGVSKGIRPERLKHFDDKCWTLMEQCWAMIPTDRPLLGYVLPQLVSIRAWYVLKASQDSSSMDMGRV